MVATKRLSKLPVVIEMIMLTIGLLLWVPAGWLAFFVYLPNPTIDDWTKLGAYVVFALTVGLFVFLLVSLSKRPPRG